MRKGKGKGKLDGDGTSRQRTISWDDEQTKFMLDWYIKYRKDQHIGFIFTKQHHMKCDDALNTIWGLHLTKPIITRHYEENWKIVERAMNKSGNGFDAIKCKVTISESEKDHLSDRARRLLCKPIKFYHEMHELFLGMHADGSLAMDQQTCMDDGSRASSSDLEGLKDKSSYPQPIDLEGNDFETLPTPLDDKAANRDISSSSKPRAGMKHPKGVKSPSKKLRKQPKSSFTCATEHFTNTMRAIQETLANPPPAPNYHNLLTPMPCCGRGWR